MKVFLTVLATLGLAIQSSHGAQNCPNVCLANGKTPCLKSNQVQVWQAKKMTNGNPCFTNSAYMGGIPVCWTSTGGNLAPCDAHKEACGHTGTLTTKSESVCKLANNRGFTNSGLIAKIVNTHNQMRNAVAGGKFGQPSAANMRKIKWSKRLATRAQAWADDLTVNGPAHPPSSVSGSCFYEFGERVGQNVASSWGSSDISDEYMIKTGIQKWFDEYQYFSPSQVSNFATVKENGEDVGHYTQVAWGETEYIGCGIANKPDKKRRYLVCNYGIGGNMKGSAMYVKGSPASKCCSGSRRDGTFPNLCN